MNTHKSRLFGVCIFGTGVAVPVASSIKDLIQVAYFCRPIVFLDTPACSFHVKGILFQ